ncbi:hypothetical protein G3M48_010376 [Beauveria asiatica]|uniref:Uncharacterized protein n=1 Tax=Beauveria asiatica TaxID=1069075 RepID=A0AAW0RHR2_9HYPO
MTRRIKTTVNKDVIAYLNSVYSPLRLDLSLQIGLPPLHSDAPKATFSAVSEAALDELLKKEPAIPKAVPAVFTRANQIKSIQQSLDNRMPGNRNVYIRGLHPTTDDELMFHALSKTWPDVQQQLCVFHISSNV